MATFKVLSTKKIDPLLVARAKDRNIEVIQKEFITIKPLLSKEKEQEIRERMNNGTRTPIVFTSQHAVDLATRYLQPETDINITGLPVFCLEGATKTKAQSSHLNIVATAPNARGLANEIISAGVTEVIFFCSNKRRDELPDILSAARVKVHEIIVYETIETPFISENVDGILFFSPSAVQSFFSLNQPGAHTVCFAIGETTAAAISDFTTNQIIVSEDPGQETIMAKVESYFRNIKCHE
jgi:uroporphyrinogen-III synthase